MKTNYYSVQYDISVYQGPPSDSVQTHELQQTIVGYLTIDALKDDVNNQIRALMRRLDINNVKLHVDMVISDANGDYCDSDSGIAHYYNGIVNFLI